MTILTSSDKFEGKIFKEPETGCWLWTGSMFQNGYGEATRGFIGKRIRAHRLAWILYRGTIPDGVQVLHKCDVKHCVNPDHLYLGTSFDNAKDAVERKMNYKSAQTHCLNNHPLSGDNLRINPKGRRVCITCQRDRSRYWNAEYRRRAKTL